VSTGSPPLILAQGLSKTFGDFEAVSDFTASIALGERVAIVGQNGAGKSTILRLLNLSHRPTTGSFFWRGIDTSTLSAEALRRLRARIGTVPQRYDLIPQLTVRMNVLSSRLGQRSLVSSFWNLFSAREDAEVERVLEMVGIAHLMHERSDRLSGGEQQRAAIARALFQRPDVLFADEPLAAVDPGSAPVLMKVLVDVCEASRCALIMTSHHLHLLRDYFPRIVGIRSGRIDFDMDSDAVSARVFSSLYGKKPRQHRPSTALREDAPEKRRTLRIGVSGEGCAFLATSVLHDLAIAHPDVSISIRSDADDPLVGQVAQGSLDLAFVLRAETTPGLDVIPVRDESVVLVSSDPAEASGTTIDELASMTILWTDHHHPVTLAVLDAFEAAGGERSELTLKLELGSIVTVKAAVESGLGCAFLPRCTVAGELDRGTLVEIPVDGLEPKFAVFAVRKSDGELADVIDAWIGLARHSIGGRRPQALSSASAAIDLGGSSRSPP
jgi:phosphonate transport system ATP-binding protein